MSKTSRNHTLCQGILFVATPAVNNFERGKISSNCLTFHQGGTGLKHLWVPTIGSHKKTLMLRFLKALFWLLIQKIFYCIHSLGHTGKYRSALINWDKYAVVTYSVHIPLACLLPAVVLSFLEGSINHTHSVSLGSDTVPYSQNLFLDSYRTEQFWR